MRYRIYDVREDYIDKFVSDQLPTYCEESRKVAMCFDWFQDRVDPQIFVCFEIFEDAAKAEQH